MSQPHVWILTADNYGLIRMDTVVEVARTSESLTVRTTTGRHVEILRRPDGGLPLPELLDVELLAILYLAREVAASTGEDQVLLANQETGEWAWSSSPATDLAAD